MSTPGPAWEGALALFRSTEDLVMAVVDTELNAVILADPDTVGMAALVTAGNHGEIARLLNETVTGTDIDVRSVRGEDLLAALDRVEFKATGKMHPDDKEFVHSLTKPGSFELVPGLKEQIEGIFALVDHPGSLAAIKPLMTRKAFRIEIAGASSEVDDKATFIQVGEALKLP